MAEEQEKKDVYLIPPNFIDTGTLFGGMMKARNAFEAVVFVLTISVPILKINITLTTKVILLCLTALPVGLFAVIGIAGESLTSFIYHFLLYVKNRRVIFGNGIEAVETIMNPIKKKNKTEDFLEEIGEQEKAEKQKKQKKLKIPKKAAGLNGFIPIDKIANGIVYTVDKRMLKIIEVEPINFLLKSAREQRNIIYSFISYLKISPVKLQFKVVTKKADINRHLNQVKEEIAKENDSKCRALQEDYAKLLKKIGNREAITRRFFIIFEYEPFLNGQKEESDGVAQLEVAARTAKTYLFQCGNEILEHENEDEFLHEVLYLLLNRTTSIQKQLSEKAAEVMGRYIAENRIDQLNDIPIASFISPDEIDLKHGHYIVVDGLYYAFMYVPSDGYKTQVGAGWLSLLINAGEGIDMDLFVFRQPRDRIQLKIGQQLRINRSKMKETSDTNTDFDDLDSAIRSGYYLKDGISNNQDFYYLSILITITASSLKELEWRQNEMKKLMVSQDLDIRICSFQQEQAFLSTMPFAKLDKSLYAKTKRNALTLGAASCYPFTSFEMSDDNGILLGVNKYNNSLIIVDIFNSKIYKNANMAILGTTGAGKTFTMQLMALRMRRKNIQVFILSPIKGHEFKRACDNIGGEFIQISPASPTCINIMEIRQTDDIATEYLDGSGAKRSRLAAKIQNLHMIFSLIIPDMNYEEKQLLDEVLIEVYHKHGITHENETLLAANGQYKKMPVIGDVYQILLTNPQTVRIANILNRFVNGSASTFNQQSNVRLNNKYTVIDLSDVTGDLLTVSMLIALLFVWDKVKEDRTAEKIVFIPELWNLIGSSSNRIVANYVLELFKTIRGYGGAVVADTQDLSDFFALDDGKYGEGILNACKTKIILNMEDKEAQMVKSVLNLSETEILNITHFGRGSGLISTNNNNVTVEFKASPLEKELITTDRYELQQIVKRKQQQRIAENELNTYSDN